MRSSSDKLHPNPKGLRVLDPIDEVESKQLKGSLMMGMFHSPFLFVSMPGPLELVLILLVVLLLFGAKRLPEIAKGLGEAMKEFKKSISDMSNKSDKDETKK